MIVRLAAADDAGAPVSFEIEVPTPSEWRADGLLRPALYVRPDGPALGIGRCTSFLPPS